MLAVNTYLDRSATHGIGLFAGEKIISGTLVWEFNPAVDLQFTLEQWQDLQGKISSQSFASLVRHSYKEDGLFYLCLDNAQFMNHDLQNDNIQQNHNSNTMHAMRDIAPDEELFCNYFDYSDPDDIHLRKLSHSSAVMQQGDFSLFQKEGG